VRWVLRAAVLGVVALVSTGGIASSALFASANTSAQKPGIIAALTCPTTRVCVALSNGVRWANTNTFVLRTTDGGRSWRSFKLSETTESGEWIACSSATRCFRPGPNGLLMTNDGGAIWIPTSFDGREGGEVACAGAWCLGFGDKHAFTSDDGGETWSSVGKSSWGEDSGWNWIHCSRNTCFAQDYKNIFRISHKDRTWRKVAHLPITQMQTEGFDCPGARTCYAAGYEKYSLAVAVTHDGGHQWLVKQFPVRGAQSLSGLDCWSVSSCATTGDTNAPPQIRVTRDGGRSWEIDRVPGTVRGQLAWLVCPAPRRCVAGGFQAPGFSALIVHTSDGGKYWGKATIAPG
jgi:photosystem II stability/assembly factor-like uncharacterized protein